ADVWKIALPASISFITEPLVGLVDITVIGRLGDAALLGGLVLGALLFGVLLSMAYFLRVGTAGPLAQLIGALVPPEGLLHVSRALIIGVIIGIAMILLSTPILWVSVKFLAPEAGVEAALGDYLYWRIWAAPFALINYSL